MATPSFWVNAIQRIKVAAGFKPARATLYLGSDFVVTDNDDEERTEVAIYVAPASGLAPLDAQMAQHPIEAGDDQSVLIVAGSDAGPVLITQLDFFPAGPVAAHAINFMAISLQESDGNGATSSISSPEPTYFDTSAVSWQVGKIAFTWPGAYELAANHSIVASVATEGGGVNLPSGVWRIT